MSRRGGWTRRQAPVVPTPRYPVRAGGQQRHGRPGQGPGTHKQQDATRTAAQDIESEEAERGQG